MPLIPAFIGGAVSKQELVFSLPTCFGGLGVANCVDSASLAFQIPCESSAILIDAIVNQGVVPLVDHLSHLDMMVHAAVTSSHEDQYQLLLSSLLSCIMSFDWSCCSVYC